MNDVSWSPLSTPTRFRSAQQGVHAHLAKAWDELSILAVWLAGRTIEIVVFGAGAGTVRWGLSLVLRRHIVTVRPAFDDTLYVRQFVGEPRRRRVMRNPLLHYVILGWREGRAPSSSFDPHYFLRRHPSLPRNIDPLLLHVVRANAQARSHELAEPLREAANRRRERNVLTIHHARGGGSTAYLDLYEAHLRSMGRDALRLRAVPGAPRLAVLHGPDRETIGVVDLACELPKLAEHCQRHGVSSIVVNHVIDRPLEVFDWIPALGRKLGGGYDVVLHDFYALCPRVNLVTGEGQFCAVAAPAACVTCTAGYGSEVKELDPYAWRPRFAKFLEEASAIIVPSGDTADRLARYFPSSRVTVWEPESDVQLPAERLPALKRDEPLRVACLGALSVPKGAYVLQMLASEALLQRAPFSFRLIGDSPNAKALRRMGVEVSGFYRGEDLGRLIEEARPHVVFLPSIWPETWSFVLSAALRQGLPVIAFDIGAPSERLRRLSRGHLLPSQMASIPTELLTEFRRLRSRWVIL